MSLKERGQQESSKVSNQERGTFGRQVGANRRPKVTVTGGGSSMLQQNNGADAETSFAYHEMSRMILYDHDEYSEFIEGRYSEFIYARTRRRAFHTSDHVPGAWGRLTGWQHAICC